MQLIHISSLAALIDHLYTQSASYKHIKHRGGRNVDIKISSGGFDMYTRHIYGSSWEQ